MDECRIPKWIMVAKSDVNGSGCEGYEMGVKGLRRLGKRWTDLRHIVEESKAPSFAFIES